jgi:hypothetical protein
MIEEQIFKYLGHCANVMKLSLILPVYKSKHYLEKNLPIIYDYLNSLSLSFEILIAEDESRDIFSENIISFIKKHKEIKFIHSPIRLGRGRAIKNSVEILNGDIIGYMDIDLATDIRYLKKVVELFEEKNYDLITGSRYLKHSKATRSIKRRIFSLFFNSLIMIMFNSKVHDHQCGFKFFRKDFIKKYGKIANNDYWFWDTEIILIAQMNKKKVYELPVEWKESRRTTVKIFSDTLIYLKEILRFYLQNNF